MAEYIERDTAIRAVMAAKWVDGSDGAMAMEIVASPPAADVAPVVHCGDCKHWKKLTSLNGYCTCAVGLREADLSDCFCSFGERQDGGADNV